MGDKKDWQEYARSLEREVKWLRRAIYLLLENDAAKKHVERADNEVLGREDACKSDLEE